MQPTQIRYVRMGGSALATVVAGRVRGMVAYLVAMTTTMTTTMVTETTVLVVLPEAAMVLLLSYCYSSELSSTRSANLRKKANPKVDRETQYHYRPTPHRRGLVAASETTG